MQKRVKSNDAPVTDHPWRTMVILLAAIFMTLLDVSIVNVALPSIQQGLHARGSALERIVSGYTLALGMVLIPAGRMGDNLGHRQTFLFGLTLFTLASLGSALSQNSTEIIIARLVQGFAAGVYTPSIVAYIELLFRGPDRSRAFSIFGAVIGVATAVGPLLGGILIQLGGSDWGWRLIFLINVPAGLILLPFAFQKLPFARAGSGEHHRLDPVGTLLVMLGLVLVLFPLVEGRTYGWPWWTWAAFAAAMLVFVALWQYEKRLERRGGEPILAIGVLKQPAFALGAAIGFIYFAAFTSVFFTLSLLWQEGFQRGALETGLLLLPFAVGNLIGSSQSHKLSAWLKEKVMLLGSVVVAIGFILVLIVLHLSGSDISAWYLVGPLFLSGIGNGIIIAPNQDFVLEHVPPGDAGSAAGMNNTARRIGTSVGLAAVGTILFSTIPAHPHGDLASAFVRGGELALRLNIIFVFVTILFVIILLWWKRRAGRSGMQ